MRSICIVCGHRKRVHNEWSEEIFRANTFREGRISEGIPKKNILLRLMIATVYSFQFEGTVGAGRKMMRNERVVAWKAALKIFIATISFNKTSLIADHR